MKFVRRTLFLQRTIRVGASSGSPRQVADKYRGTLNQSVNKPQAK